MDWDRIEWNWQRFSLKAKHRWNRLSENELKLIRGQRDELCAKIQQAYGIGRCQAELQIADWLIEQDDSEQSEHGSQRETR